MPNEGLVVLVCAALAVALLIVVVLHAKSKGVVGALRSERDSLRSERDAIVEELRSERNFHGAARGDVAKLEATVSHLSSMVAKLERTARETSEDHGKLQRQHGELQTAHARLQADTEGRITAAEERIGELKQLREDMTVRFKSLADDLFKDHGERFGSLNQERMTALLKPMREQVDHFQRELREAHTGAAKDRERLKTEIEQLSRRSEEVSREAVALTKALKGEKQKQGAWGEMILERLLEDSGLTKGREYRTQFSVTDAEGRRRRPDVIVNLPDAKVVVIDAKVSLVAYEAAVNATQESDRQQHMRAHRAAVRAHIDELATRDYASMVDGAVDYVLMFMPVEGALAAALEVQGDLTSYAISRRVGIATPTTLMMALRTIQHVWAVENRQRNAEEIATRAGRLHDKMAGVVDAFVDVGHALDTAQRHHSTALDRLSRGSGNVLGQFDKLRRLGARTNKTMAVDHDVEDADDADDADDAGAFPIDFEAAAMEPAAVEAG